MEEVKFDIIYREARCPEVLFAGDFHIESELLRLLYDDVGPFEPSLTFIALPQNAHSHQAIIGADLVVHVLSLGERERIEKEKFRDGALIGGNFVELFSAPVKILVHFFDDIGEVNRIVNKILSFQPIFVGLNF